MNSPILFNIYTSDVLRLFGDDSETSSKAIAFADDLIIYNIDQNSKRLKENLQSTFDKVQIFYSNWKLKINITKCETILFRRSTSEARTELIKNYKKFKLIDKTKNNQELPHKTLVKYLGIHLDDRLLLTKHIDIQLKKTKNAWTASRSLFYSKYLDFQVKIIAYLSLIRPILTYACQIWFNITAYKMEEIRRLERRFLRSCIGFMRARDPDTKKFKSNKILYEVANISRIDNHIINLTRGYCASASMNADNEIISRGMTIMEDLYSEIATTKYIPPEAFVYLDHKGLIQDSNNIPIIYHIRRKTCNRSITYPTNILYGDSRVSWRYDTSTSIKDRQDDYKKDQKRYWWLSPKSVNYKLVILFYCENLATLL